MTLAVTVMTPLAPTAIMGRVSASSPASTVRRSPQVWAISEACWTEPLPSLTPTIFFITARRATVAGNMLTPVRPGML